VTRRAAALVAALMAALCVARPAAAHPLHVTYADVAVDRGAATVTLRVYTDDLLRAAGGAARVDAYVRAHFALRDAAGRAVALAPCGRPAQGDMTHLCLRGAAPAGALREMRVTNDLLVALYADQMNVVRSSAGRTVLFTRDRTAQSL
jgi:hypothetical protein